MHSQPSYDQSGIDNDGLSEASLYILSLSLFWGRTKSTLTLPTANQIANTPVVDMSFYSKQIDSSVRLSELAQRCLQNLGDTMAKNHTSYTELVTDSFYLEICASMYLATNKIAKKTEREIAESRRSNAGNALVTAEPLFNASFYGSQ
jgi:hypothetical protein